VDTVEYDFENYALEHGIPETLDPLPYRKTGSVFGSGGDSGDAGAANEPVLTSAKNDPRLRTVVCRHWLRDLCMKGAACEFLHVYDLSRMPLCRWGERCKVKDCPFRHIAESNRMECVFYSQGFCIHGPFCRYKHERRSRADLPVVADFTLGLSQMQASAGRGGDPNSQQQQLLARRPAPKPNEFYKISLCKHFLAGNCPFGENCHFAHGEAELRPYPGREEPPKEAVDTGGPDAQSSSSFVQYQHHHHHDNVASVDYYQGGAAGGGKPIPVLEPEQASYFVVLAATQRDLAISTVEGEWYLQKRHALQVNSALEKNQPVMMFFTVHESSHFQGAALVTSPASYEGSVDNEGGDDHREECFEPYCYRIGLEWYRTCELPIKTALDAVPDLAIPTFRTESCLTLPPKTGELLLKVIWNSPLVTLYEAWSDDAPEPPAPEAILTDFRCPPDDEVAWPTMPGPGFIFGCSSDTMDECLGRGVFGLPGHMRQAASCIVPGSTIFLFNVTDRLLFGIFEALTPAIMDIVPAAFSRNPKATSSPFPVQIRVRVALECPPLEDTDPILNDILRSRKGRIGSLTQAQTSAIASMLAYQCGALQYMMEYQRGVQEGARVRAPPIALPPKQIPTQ
jgi:cleavage and polyadenylation specificity factor subunit 4